MKNLLVLFLICIPLLCDAQIGYQVALLSSATGEPRANETVSVNVAITDSKDNSVYSGTQTVTSNDFGILSLTVGNSDTFKDVAIGRLPLFISVSVDGRLIGKSQILSVPVAEVATTLKSDFTLDDLCGKLWIINSRNTSNGLYQIDYTFNKNGTCVYRDIGKGEVYSYNLLYRIEGNNIYVYGGEGCTHLLWVNGKLYDL